MKDSRLLGGSAIRVDSLQKVTGQARYAEDIDLPGLLIAAVVRCPHHHARLLALGVEEAARQPGVVRVVTAGDIPGENGFPEYSLDEPLLVPVGGTAPHVGAPVAFVVAATRELAGAGARAVEAKWELLPHTFEADETLQPGALPIHADGNLLNTFRVAHGDLEAAFTASDVVLETHYTSSFQEHAALEREAALGFIDEEGRVAVVCATHEPHWQQNWIAAALALPPEQVRVIVPPTGGSFGGKQDPWPLIAAGLLTYLTGQPVRLAYTRRESFDASPKRHPYDLRFRVGATVDGRLTGIQVRVTANTGGYDGAGYFIPNYAVTGSGGPYRWQAVDAEARVVYTNGPKCGQFRGFGSPQSVFASECTLDELIERLGAHPVDFRLNNAIEQDSISFLGYPVAESLGYAEVLEAIRPRYEAFVAEAAAFNADPRRSRGEALRKGVGLAGMWYRFGKSGSLRVETHAELARDGGFVVYASAPDYGQGINTVLTQLAAETLGIPRDLVTLVNADTARVPDSGIQGASRATYFVGSSVCVAAENLRQTILGTAAELVGCPPADLALERGRVVSTAGPAQAVSLAEVAAEMDRLGVARRVLGVFDLSARFPEETRPEYTPHFVTGAHLAEVIVDLETGQVRVTRFVAVHDIGRAINPPDTQGQVEGSIVMGLGSALCEAYIPGKTTGLTDYILPMVSEMPEIEVILVEVPSFDGPFGAKGIGEVAMLPSTPAIINAVSRAIGARIRAIPATPEHVLAAISQNGGPHGR